MSYSCEIIIGRKATFGPYFNSFCNLFCSCFLNPVQVASWGIRHLALQVEGYKNSFININWNDVKYLQTSFPVRCTVPTVTWHDHLIGTPSG